MRRCSALLLCLTAVVAGCGADDTPAPPAQIVAITRSGDVVVIDRATRTRTTRASFPQSKDEETGLVYGRADEVAPLPDGRILVSICCEPAGGAIVPVDRLGRRSLTLSGWDPEVSPDGTWVAAGSVLGVFVFDASTLSSVPRVIEGDRSEHVRDPSWSRDGQTLLFAVEGRLGRVPADAESLDEVELLEPRAGTYWGLPVFTSDGVVAVEHRRGPRIPWDPLGRSRMVRVDLDTGEREELASSAGPITDVAVDASGHYLLWVDREGLKWRLGDRTERLDGEFVAAAWASASRS